MDIFNRVLCKESIKLEPRFINKGFKTEILSRLKKRVEGVCSKHGFIKHDSVELYKISPGTIELITLSGNVVYDVYFYADICNPLVGNIVTAIVSNVNRFGILANVGYVYDGKEVNVLDIIIAKNSVKIQSELDLNVIKIGDELKLEILGKKLELGEKKISSIGRVIKDVKQVEKSRKSCKDINKDINNDINEIVSDQEDLEDLEDIESLDDSDEDRETLEESDNDEESSDLSENIDDLDEEVKTGGEIENFFSDDDNIFDDGNDEGFDDEGVDDIDDIDIDDDNDI
jgi:DNA-directed RNA polymerase subunit E'/Rpb7